MNHPHVLQESLLDLVFRGRNHAYGAYELRLHYGHRLKKAFVSMILLVVAASFTLEFFSHRSKTVSPPLTDKALTLSSIQEMPEEHPEVLPPSPPRAPVQPAPSVAATPYTPFRVVKDQAFTPQDAPPDISRIQVTSIGAETVTGTAGTGVTLEPGRGAGNANGHAERASAAPFVSVERMPRFPRSKNDEQSVAMIMAYLSERIRYPDQARENGIQGTVVIRFVVGPDGQLSNIQLGGSDPGGGIAAEAIRVISGMPRWIPGRQNGRPVSVWFSLPVRFRLY